MLPFLPPLILGMLLLFPFLYARVIEKRVAAVIIKAFVSSLFIATAIVSTATSKNPSTPFTGFIIPGLFFGLLGDIFLDLKYIILKREMSFTVLGFIAFAIGHLFYVLGLFLYYYDYSSSVLYIIIPLIVTAVLMTATLLMEKISKIRYLKMKPFVIIYSFFLFFTTSMYMSVAIQGHWQVTTIDIMAIGLILFAISDLILNNTYFAPGFTGPFFIISNHVTYYIAQFLIALSLFFII